MIHHCVCRKNDELSIEVEVMDIKFDKLVLKRFPKCKRCGKAVPPAKYKNEERYKIVKEKKCACAHEGGKF